MMDAKKPMKFAQKTKDESIKDTWKVLIVDDEESVHTITNAVLNGITFDHKKLEFFSAYSGTQARELMQEHSDIALILLDVVMENDNAGLEFVDFVRNDLENKMVRIVLRTGQPGYAPEKEVIDQYDINDYKEKTELTAQKLYTTVITSLRNFKDLIDLQNQKIPVEKKQNSMMYEFSQTALDKLITTMKESCDGKCEGIDIVVCEFIKEDKLILASTQNYKGLDYEGFISENPDIQEAIEKALELKSSISIEKGMVSYYEDESGNENIVYVNSPKHLSQNDIQLIEMFSFNISSAIELYYK